MGMIEIKKASNCRSCNCCNGKNDVKEITFWNEYSGTTVALCRECREETCRMLEEPKPETRREDSSDRIKTAYHRFCAEYDRTPETIYMTPGLYQKLKADAEKRGFVEPPFPHIARIYGAKIELFDAPGDIAFFGTLAVGN